jgi:hypothetical protein
MAFEGIGRTEIGIGAGVVVLIAVIAGVVASSSGGGSVDEVPRIVDAIRDAQLAHRDRYDELIATDWAPRPRYDADAQAVPWIATAGFDRLGWRPEPGETLVGTYRVTVDGKGGFVVTGVCDVDEDGRQAVYVATEEAPAQLTTDPSVR